MNFLSELSHGDGEAHLLLLHATLRVYIVDV
jgi:hypothetical protein